MLEYDSIIITVHSETSGHVKGYFDDALNDAVKGGWRLVTVQRLDHLRYLAIFERGTP